MEYDKIICGNSKSMKEIPDESIRLIVTSPPYFTMRDYGHPEQIGLSDGSYENYLESLLEVWKECYRVLKPNGKLCINAPLLPMSKKEMNTHHSRDILNINNDIEFTILKNTEFYRYNTMIWDKGNTDKMMMGSCPYPPNILFFNTIEFINVFVKDGKPEIVDKQIKEQSRLDKSEWYKYIQSIWKIQPESNRKHPAPFPVEIPLRLIKLFSFVGDVILDPFMGSGTTAIAAIQIRRHYIGYDINENYVKMAEDRIKNFTIQENFL
jgi:DNA modification methylase